MWEVIVLIATVLALLLVLSKLPFTKKELLEAEAKEGGDSKTGNNSPLPSDLRSARKLSLEEKKELADQLFEQGDLKKAEKLYLDLVVEEPQNASLYNKLGLLYLENKNLKDAKSALLQALDLEKENDTFYNNLGLILYEAEAYEEAIDAYEKSIAINKGVASRFANLGLAYFMVKKYRKAADAFEKALVLDPENEKYKEQLKGAEEKIS